jgi:hypothetical protein
MVTVSHPSVIGNPSVVNVTNVKCGVNGYDYTVFNIDLQFDQYESYAVCVDKTMPAPRDLLLAGSFVTTTPGSYKITLARYDAAALVTPVTVILPTGLTNDDISPAIVSDDTPDPISNKGGCLLAWCTSVPTGPNTVDVGTLTIRYTYTLVNNVLTPAPVGVNNGVPLALHPTITSGSCTYPDLALNKQAPGDDPSAIVAWQGPHEDQCGFHLRKILCQNVVYIPPDIQAVWPDPRYASPSSYTGYYPDDYPQTAPMLVTSQGNTVGLFWNDWRVVYGGSIAFTRL